MATAAGNLVVRLMAQTNQFERGMKQSAQQTAALRAGVAKLGAGLRMLSGAFLGVASVGGIGMLIKRNMELLDTTGKLSDRLGIATERLQGLRHAAEISGASTGQLDRGLEMMNRRLGEAVRGTGEARRGLETLGLSAQALAAASPDQAFYAIAEAISQIESPAVRASVATDIFGRGAAELINTLALGSAGLSEMQSEAERLGMTFDRSAAAAAERANDAMTRLKSSFSGAATAITADLAPAFEILANAISEVPRLFAETQLAVTKFILWNEQKKGDWWGWMGDWEPGGQERRIYIEELERTIAELEQVTTRRASGGAAPAGGPMPLDQFTAGAGGSIAISGALDAMRGMMRSAAAMFRMPTAPDRDPFTGRALPTIGRDQTVSDWTPDRDPFTGEAIGGTPGGRIGGLIGNLLGSEFARGVGASMRDLGDRLNLYNELKPIGEQLRLALETPAEAFERRLEEIDRLAGIGAITQDTQVRALKQLRDEFAPDEAGPTRFAGAMEKGSREAFSAILAAQGLGRDKPEKEVAKNTARTAELLIETNRRLTELTQQEQVEIPPA